MTRIASRFSRRQFLAASAAGAAAIVSRACDRLSAAPTFREFLAGAEGLTQRVQRALLWSGSLAREYSRADISPAFRANGSQDASGLPPGYVEAAERGFPDWRLQVDGLVNRPSSFTLRDIQQLPARSQITRHDCVEGWSAIGKWTGVPLSLILQTAGLRPNARYAVFYCADELEITFDGSGRYYESIDLVDAFHPQTILAYSMNGADLPVGHGAPLRLRVERQLGYKHAKYIMRISMVDSFSGLWGGKGGFWEDRGYQWYAGI